MEILTLHQTWSSTTTTNLTKIKTLTTIKTSTKIKTPTNTMSGISIISTNRTTTPTNPAPSC